MDASQGSRSGIIVWTDGAIYGRPINQYRVEGRTNHNSTWVVLADRQTAVEPDYTSSGVEINGRRQMDLVNKLSPFAAYQFRIAAYNEIGMGEYSEPSPSYNTRLVFFVVLASPCNQNSYFFTPCPCF